MGYFPLGDHPGVDFFSIAMFKKSLYISLIIAAVMPTLAQQKPCNKADRDSVEEEAVTLRTWDALYQSYRRFRHCMNDADAEEGYSESVARILADHWETLPRLAYLIKRDREFGDFVGLDATTSMDDVRKIKENAMNHCPRGLTAICTKLKRDAESAVAEDAAAHEHK